MKTRKSKKKGQREALKSAVSQTQSSVFYIALCIQVMLHK